MTPHQLFKEGKLTEAIDALVNFLRDNPGNAQQRTFLFELLCFAGEYDRADKHLDLLAGGTHDRQMGAMLMRAAVQTARTRDDMFANGEVAPAEVGAPIAGVLNGKPFQSILDADPRVGPRLEVFAAGNYLMLPLVHIAELDMEPPKRLRDLLWAPAHLRCGAGFGGGQDLGDVMLPALSPLSSRHPDDLVRLGRASSWESDGSMEMLFGQKLLLVDGEEVPFLEVRNLTITAPSGEADAVT
ncbi:type VI secretion system accessory protein TagJ [uncultured Paludibaculum sp.]|uniref:type VI secretion system accessory protein TagJ n=1 Tax=uncultured Paludibaculum sp. TaxID=1765020 RepID=UPI002AAB8BB5|nr:type VI secretion system accessory protein TagJ [uncultured Paludibaculum sp.]